MLRKLVGLAIASVVPFLVASALLTPQPLTATYFPNAAQSLDRLTPPDGGRDIVDPLGEPGRRGALRDEENEEEDLLGNPVSSAVATYKFDATGSLYETHSPQTALPRLGAPKS